jgi:hypothetical protein
MVQGSWLKLRFCMSRWRTTFEEKQSEGHMPGTSLKDKAAPKMRR